jgi:uncharacterized membrane protein HdeD (DUF308 family)
VRAAAILLLAGMWVAAAMTMDRAGHPLAGYMALALPLAFVLHYVLLAAHERTGTASLQTVRHLGAWWLLLAVLPTELSWQAQQLAPGVKLWPFMAWALTLAAGIALPALGERRGTWPFATAQGGYVPIGIAPPALGLVVLLVWGNLHLAGASGLGLPYVPVLNFFDATQLSGIGALLLLSRALDEQLRPPLRYLAAALAFVWLSALAGRIAHHWGGVPFEMHALMRSTLFQAILTLFWTITAIGTMIHASRRSLRELWFGGFGLLGIVGAKLLLFDATGRGTVTWTATLIGVALLVLAMFFAASILVDGALNVVGSLQHREKDGWWLMLLIGILGLVVGAYALLNPPVSMMAFIYLVAFQAILLGVFLAMLGYKVRAATSREWILYLTGALSILFGILVVINPLAGSLSIVYLIACWALVIGVLKVFFAFKVKNLPEQIGNRLSGLR